MKKIYVFLGAIIASGATFAQYNSNYEFQATQKHAPYSITAIDNRDAINNNQDRTTYYSEDFDAMADLSTTWIAAIQGSPSVGFELTSTGHANDAGSTFFIPALLSSTPTQWVLLDSDSDGSSGNDEDATLTSPTIDLTANGYTSGPLKLEFEQFFAEWEQAPNYDTLYIGISDDAGATWDEMQISNGVGREGRPNPELVSLNISSYIVDPTQVQVRFRWDGNWAYGWQLDNVAILDLPDHDLIVQDVFRGDLVNSIMYSRIPEAQTVPFVLGADIKNIGFEDLTNVSFDWEIFDPSMTSIGSGSAGGSLTLTNGQNDTVWFTTAVTPTALGNYTIEFTATSDSVELALDQGNNEATDDYFWLTEFEYGADYDVPTGAFYNWANNNDGAASIGNIFLIQADGVIGGMRSELDNNAQVADKLMFYTIYKFDGTDYVYETQTSDYTTMASDEGEWVDLIFDNPVSVVAGDQILGMAAHYGGTESAGWEMQGRVAQGAVLGQDATSQLVNLIDPSAPAVRLLMQDFTGIEDETAENRFDIYPNPANEAINVNILLTNSSNTVINVLDISGKIVKSVNVGTLEGEKNLSIDVQDMTTGVYFIELINEQGKQVKKFVKK